MRSTGLAISSNLLNKVGSSIGILRYVDDIVAKSSINQSINHLFVLNSTKKECIRRSRSLSYLLMCSCAYSSRTAFTDYCSDRMFFL